MLLFILTSAIFLSHCTLGTIASVQHQKLIPIKNLAADGSSYIYFGVLPTNKIFIKLLIEFGRI